MPEMVKDETKSQQPQTPDPQRRQLLRGLSAVPVVATLTPISASALSMACTEKPPPNLPTGTTAITDKPPNAAPGEYQCLTSGTSPAVPPQTADVNDPFNGTVVNTDVLTTGETGTAALGNYVDNNTNPNPTSRQCVIYIDGSGQYTYNSQSAGASPIAASCMLSLANA